MGKKKLDVMAKERENFIHGQVDENGNVIIPGCVRNGIDEESANKIFDEMAEFAKYAFNKSHAAAYAVVSYRTAYLKRYYPEEFMAATLNSFLGNLDKVPEYIDECKRLGIEILKPNINKSFTKFIVDNKKIRFGLGSVKNVGIAAVDAIVAEREKNGPYKGFTDFCERIQSEAVNKKCIECLIKAGAFDDFEQTRSTLVASFEGIIDTINDGTKKSMAGQVTMFDLGQDDEKLEEIKYTFNNVKEFSEKELLKYEKEMLGIYISGHPLDKLRNEIAKGSNINAMQIMQIQEANDLAKDGRNVKYAGIITSVKKKFTKNNKRMAFVTVEDLYGSCEIIVFENCYVQCSDILFEDSIVVVDGRLSVREDEAATIVAKEIKELKETKEKILNLNITDLDEDKKDKLRGTIKFFMGDKNNIKLQIENGENISSAGAIYLTNDILKEFEEVIGTTRVKILE